MSAALRVAFFTGLVNSHRMAFFSSFFYSLVLHQVLLTALKIFCFASFLLYLFDVNSLVMNLAAQSCCSSTGLGQPAPTPNHQW